MRSRSKKYFRALKANSGEKKGSSTNAGYDEQNEKTSRDSKKNPAPAKTEDSPNVEASEQKHTHASYKPDDSSQDD